MDLVTTLKQIMSLVIFCSFSVSFGFGYYLICIITCAPGQTLQIERTEDVQKTARTISERLMYAQFISFVKGVVNL